MLSTLVALLAAYLAGRFLARPGDRAPAVVAPLIEGLTITVLAGLFLGSLTAWLLGLLLLASAGLALVRQYVLPRRPVALLGELTAALAVLACLAWTFPVGPDGAWARTLDGPGLALYHQALVLLAGAIIAVPVGGILLDRVMTPFAAQLDAADSPAGGLREGGRYIGWLERALVGVLYLGDQGAVIGFVIAAKSLLRFGEIRDAAHRKLAEYILIGTLLSFAWALAWAVLTRHALGLF